MQWFAKKIFDERRGGGKNKEQSTQYLYTTLNLVKFCVKKIISTIRTKLLNRCISNAACRCNMLYEKSTRVEYDKIVEVRALTPRIGCSLKQNSMIFLRKLSLRATNRGAILIEFAICMPILIILLFYINDLVRIKRYYSQTEFVAQQIANILQNISQKRAQSYGDIERRKQLRINLTDVARANKLASLTIYPALTQSNHALMHYPYVNMYYIKNNKNGTVSSKWRNYWSNGSTSSSCSTGGTGCSAVFWKTNVSPSSIYPTLKFNTEDGKIIIEMYMRLYNGDKKNTYGLRMVTPRSKSTNCTCCEFFQSIVIFTPKPGLFYDSAIKSSYTDSDF